MAPPIEKQKNLLHNVAVFKKGRLEPWEDWKWLFIYVFLMLESLGVILDSCLVEEL